MAEFSTDEYSKNYSDAISETNLEYQPEKEKYNNLLSDIKQLKRIIEKLVKDNKSKNTELARREKIIIGLQEEIEELQELKLPILTE